MKDDSGVEEYSPILDPNSLHTELLKRSNSLLLDCACSISVDDNLNSFCKSVLCCACNVSSMDQDIFLCSLIAAGRLSKYFVEVSGT